MMTGIRKTGKYRCPICSGTKFTGHQLVRTFVYVNEYGNYMEDLPGGIEANVYDSEKPYGPFECVGCGKEYDELPEEERVTLPRGTFLVVRGELVRNFLEAGYGYHHEDDGFVVIGDGMRAVAVTKNDYDKYVK